MPYNDYLTKDQFFNGGLRKFQDDNRKMYSNGGNWYNRAIGNSIGKSVLPLLTTSGLDVLLNGKHGSFSNNLDALYLSDLFGNGAEESLQEAAFNELMQGAQGGMFLGNAGKNILVTDRLNQKPSRR